MKINLIKQPDGSSLCGQACVAMVARISLLESIKLFDSRGRTRTRQLYNALKKRGISCSDKAVRIRNNNKPKLCILTIHYTFTKVVVKSKADPTKLGTIKCESLHWCVWNDNKYYDPAHGIKTKLDDSERETSFIKINI